MSLMTCIAVSTCKAFLDFYIFTFTFLDLKMPNLEKTIVNPCVEIANLYMYSCFETPSHFVINLYYQKKKQFDA